MAEAIRRFRETSPKVGFLLVGPWDREMDSMRRFVKEQKIEDAVCLLASVPHDTFLTLLSRAAAYIRTPVSDGICSSVLESLKLKVPVLAADNGTRPAGTALWREGDIESLLTLMTEATKNHAAMVAPSLTSNWKTMPRSLPTALSESVLKRSSAGDARELRVGT